LPDTQTAAPSALLDWFHLHPFLGHPISSIKICDRENPLRPRPARFAKRSDIRRCPPDKDSKK
ncbi:hypothetical protein, partial [Alistipes indistinctus]|uniref:hypothetical protein n=1 Tax=Alistipes indistinctus TaxID=626932 RepID=UPI0026745B27